MWIISKVHCDIVALSWLIDCDVIVLVDGSSFHRFFLVSRVDFGALLLFFLVYGRLVHSVFDPANDCHSIYNMVVFLAPS